LGGLPNFLSYCALSRKLVHASKLNFFFHFSLVLVVVRPKLFNKRNMSKFACFQIWQFPLAEILLEIELVPEASASLTPK
jgi:hypothetical protein